MFEFRCWNIAVLFCYHVRKIHISNWNKDILIDQSQYLTVNTVAFSGNILKFLGPRSCVHVCKIQKVSCYAFAELTHNFSHFCQNSARCFARSTSYSLPAKLMWIRVNFDCVRYLVHPHTMFIMDNSNILYLKAQQEILTTICYHCWNWRHL